MFCHASDLCRSGCLDFALQLSASVHDPRSCFIDNLFYDFLRVIRIWYFMYFAIVVSPREYLTNSCIFKPVVSCFWLGTNLFCKMSIDFSFDVSKSVRLLDKQFVKSSRHGSICPSYKMHFSLSPIPTNLHTLRQISFFLRKCVWFWARGCFSFCPRDFS